MTFIRKVLWFEDLLCKEIQDLGGKLKWATMNETVNWEKIIG